MSSKSPKNPPKNSQNARNSVRICRIQPKKQSKSSENSVFSGAIPTEKVGVDATEVPSEHVCASKKTVKCGHCGCDVVVEGDWAEELGDFDTICKMCNTPDWTVECMVCGARPTHRVTSMCGPCTFGEAETIDGNW